MVSDGPRELQVASCYLRAGWGCPGARRKRLDPKGLQAGWAEGLLPEPGRSLSRVSWTLMGPRGACGGKVAGSTSRAGVTEGPSQAYRGSAAWGGKRAYLGPAFSCQRKGLLFPGCSEPAGGKGEKNRQPGSQVPCQTLPGRRRPHTHRTQAQAWQATEGRVPAAPIQAGGQAPAPASRSHGPSRAAPDLPATLLLSPSPRAGPPPPRRRWALAGPQCRRLRSWVVHGEQGSAASAKPCGFYHARSTLLLWVISIQPTRRLSVSV